MSLIDDRRRYWKWGKSGAAVVAAALAWAGGAGAQDQAPQAAHSHPPRVVKPGVKTPGVQRPLSALHPETVYPVEGSPDWSVMAKDAVWITSARANHVVQLLPETGKPGLMVDIPKPCSGLAYGWDSVWVPSCGERKLLRLDEATGKVIAEIPADPANSEGSIAVGAGSVWLVVKPSTLIRVDPKKNAVVATLELPSESEDPAFGEGYLWITSFGHDQLLKVDPKTNKVVATIAVGPQPRFLTVGAGAVWTLNQGDGTISRVAAKTDKLVATIECGIPGTGGDITFGAGSVWATLYGFPLTQVDAKTNIPVKQWAGKGGDGLRFGFGSLWLSNGGQQNVWRVSPEQQ
jgi:virginiamycin B lyase